MLRPFPAHVYARAQSAIGLRGFFRFCSATSASSCAFEIHADSVRLGVGGGLARGAHSRAGRGSRGCQSVREAPLDAAFLLHTRSPESWVICTYFCSQFVLDSWLPVTHPNTAQTSKHRLFFPFLLPSVKVPELCLVALLVRLASVRRQTEFFAGRFVLSARLVVGLYVSAGDCLGHDGDSCSE